MSENLINNNSEDQINSLLTVLKTLHIFMNLEKEEILEILKISQIKKYDKNTIIFQEGETDRSLFVIIDGRVEIISESIKTKEKVSLFLAGKGLTFGEMSFLDSQPRSATIKTTEATNVFIISRKFFDMLLEQEPKVAAKFLLGLSDILSRRLRATDQRLKYSM